jgi:hypothetical protein
MDFFWDVGTFLGVLAESVRNAWRMLRTGVFPVRDELVPVPRVAMAWRIMDGRVRALFVWSALGLLLWGLTVIWHHWYPQYFPAH